MKSYSVPTQMKATEQYFPVVLFILLYRMVLTLEFVTQFQMKIVEQFVFHKPVVLRMKSV